jgi:guanylate kinase
VINDDLDTCVRELHEIIRAAHNTPSRNQEFIEKMRKELEGEK